MLFGAFPITVLYSCACKMSAQRVTKPRVHTIPFNIKHFSSSKLSSSSLFFCFLSVSLCTHLRTANLADTKLGGAGAGAS